MTQPYLVCIVDSANIFRTGKNRLMLKTNNYCNSIGSVDLALAADAECTLAWCIFDQLVGAVVARFINPLDFVSDCVIQYSQIH